MNVTIDDTIARVEQLYTALTGKSPPTINGNGAPIPPESDPLVHVEDQLGRMVSTAALLLPTPVVPAWAPRAIAWRSDGGIAFAIDVPGVPRDQIHVQIDRRGLTVTGQRPAPWAHGQPARIVDGCELPLGAFARTFWLPMPVSSEHVSARLDDGVLTIRIEDTPRGEPSQISIRS